MDAEVSCSCEGGNGRNGGSDRVMGPRRRARRRAGNRTRTMSNGGQQEPTQRMRAAACELQRGRGKVGKGSSSTSTSTVAERERAAVCSHVLTVDCSLRAGCWLLAVVAVLLIEATPRDAQDC